MNTGTFSLSDFDDRSVFNRLQTHIGWSTRRQRWIFALAIAVPLIVLAVVTYVEDRLWLGSLFSQVQLNGKSYRLGGMSFIGDSMVWGFTLAVPVIVVIMSMATKRTVTLVNTVAEKATPEWKQDPSPLGLKAAIEQTQRIWKMRPYGSKWGSRVLRLLRYGPWVVALAFCAFNAITCLYYDSPDYSHWPRYHNWPNYQNWPHVPYPYTSDKVTLQPLRNAPQTLRIDSGGEIQTVDVHTAQESARTVTLDEPVKLRKWDCERTIAPWSAWLTRVWTLLYYGALPFVLRHLLLLVWGAVFFLRASARWEKRRTNTAVPALDINPFHPDGFGGLNTLSDAVIMYLYGVSFFALLLGLAFLKEGMEPALHDYVLMMLFIPFAVGVVLVPSIAVRRTIVGAKERFLTQLSQELHLIGNKILQALPAGNLAKELRDNQLDKQQTAMRQLYDEVHRMSEWPFDATVIARIAVPLATPWLPPVIKEVAEKILS